MLFSEYFHTVNALYGNKFDNLHMEEDLPLDKILNEDELIRLLEVRDKAKAFLEELDNHQIII